MSYKIYINIRYYRARLMVYDVGITEKTIIVIAF